MKKMVSIMLVVLMVATLFAGCATKDETTKESNASTTSSDEKTEETKEDKAEYVRKLRWNYSKP